MLRPTTSIIVTLNGMLKEPDEFFDEDDETARIERILLSLETIYDPVLYAGMLLSRLARTQAFTEGNKRTALAVGHFVLTFNKLDPLVFLPPDDEWLQETLVKAAMGADVEQELLEFMGSNIDSSLRDKQHKPKNRRSGGLAV